jgi:hypothetical protein
MDPNPAFRTTVLVLAMAASTALSAESHEAQSRAAAARLDELIDRAIDRGGPFFTPKERDVIERACGYGPGTWNGSQVNMVRDVFHCTNGRRVSSPEVRAVMAAASPRIDAYVDAVMEQPEIVAAIERVAREAVAEQTRRSR